MSELESMGKTLMEIALQYTHPKYEGMYPDWGAVCNIGEEIVRMSGQPQLNENQQIVFEWLKEVYQENDIDAFTTILDLLRPTTLEDEQDSAYAALSRLKEDEQFQVLVAFAEWGLLEVEK